MNLTLLVQPSLQGLNTVLKELLLVIQLCLDILVDLHILHTLVLHVLLVQVIIH